MISREIVQRGFPIRPLGEVAEFLDNRRRPITASERIPGPYPYYGANGQQDSVADYIFDEPLILLAEDGGRFDQPDRGIAYAIEGKTWVNNHAHVLRPRDNAQLRYLVRVLENYDVTPWITGSTRAKLTKAGASKIQVPLPPLAEQKRIAGILDTADALRVKRREALAQLDTLTQSIFLDMFGDPVTNPMGWEVTTVSRIGSVQGGLQVTSKRRSLPIERPYLRVANVFRGFLELDEIKTIRLTESELLRTSLDYEDILIVEGHGNKAEIGRCARWDGSIDQCVHQNHLIRLRCDRSKASPIYVENFINSPGGRRGLIGTSRTTSGLNTISVSKVRGSEIQLPSLHLQHRFAAIVESIERQKASQRTHLAELDTLFAALQSRAFRGDI